jgi:hypothetical protein
MHLFSPGPILVFGAGLQVCDLGKKVKDATVNEMGEGEGQANAPLRDNPVRVFIKNEICQLLWILWISE